MDQNTENIYYKKLYIFHYSSEIPFVAREIEVKKDIHIYEFENISSFFIINELDPVVIIRLDRNHIMVLGGNILKYNSLENQIEILVDDFQDVKQMRLFKRYPASCFVDIKPRDIRKRYGAIIKDISKYGMKIYSKTEFEPKTLVEIDISFGQIMYFLDATVINKDNNGSYFEYGLNVSGADIQSSKELRAFLSHYQEGCVRKIDPSILDKTIDIEYIFEIDEAGNMTKKLESAAAKLENILRRSKR